MNNDIDIGQITEALNDKMDRDGVNADVSNSFVGQILGSLQTTDSSKVGYVYSLSGVTTAVYAPNGGKWLVLYVYCVNSSTAVAYLFSQDVLHFPGEVVDGGTQIVGVRSGYFFHVALVKIQ